MIGGEGMTSTERRPADELDDLSWWIRPVAERDALFARLRATDPRPFVAERDLGGRPRGGGFWALTRYDDVWEVSRRPGDFCSGQGTVIFDQPPSLREYRGSIIDMDNPEHNRLRRIVNRGFTPRAIARLRHDVAVSAREIIAEVSERGECDFVTEVAALLPLRVFNMMMGIPRGYERFIFEQTNIIMGASDPEYVPDQSPRAVAAAVFAAGERLAELLRELAAERIAAPKDDLISGLISAREEQPDAEYLDPEELARLFILLVGAGNETTRNALAHGLLALTQFPDQRQLWRADPHTYADPAVEEILRWGSPVLYMPRRPPRTPRSARCAATAPTPSAGRRPSAGPGGHRAPRRRRRRCPRSCPRWCAGVRYPGPTSGPAHQGSPARG
jgi:cytochrome P450